MPLKSLMNKPVFAVGLLMTIILFFQAGEKYNWWASRRQKLMPSSCKAVLVKLEKRIPANWKAFCEGDTYNNLAIVINFALPKNKEKEKEKELSKETLRTLFYRQMANDLITIAKIAPGDNLERTDIIRVRLNHEKFRVDAITEGKYLVKFQTLTDKRLIAEHLKVTVQVKETFL